MGREYQYTVRRSGFHDYTIRGFTSRKAAEKAMKKYIQQHPTGNLGTRSTGRVTLVRTKVEWKRGMKVLVLCRPYGRRIDSGDDMRARIVRVNPRGKGITVRLEPGQTLFTLRMHGGNLRTVRRNQLKRGWAKYEAYWKEINRQKRLKEKAG